MHELPEVRHRPRPGSIFLGLLVVTIVGTAGYLLGSLRAGGEREEEDEEKRDQFRFHHGGTRAPSAFGVKAEVHDG